MHKRIRFILTFLFLMLFWLILSLNFQFPSIIIGIVISLFISVLSYNLFIQGNEGIHSKIIGTVWYLFIYVFVLLYEMFLASLDVVYRVATMDINPEIVMIKTDIKSDLGILLLANSITLTPGTITVDTEGEYIYVHWLYARTTNFGHASELIKGRFEQWLERIFR
ncbi:MAG: Na+/H+ antiporter subunit E [Atribacterota bacterium]